MFGHQKKLKCLLAVELIFFVPKGSKRVLSGARRSWGKPEEEDIIFNQEFRIAGNPDDIRQALLSTGYDNETIEYVIASSISKENYNDFLDTFDSEEIYRSRKVPQELRPPLRLFGNITEEELLTIIEIYNQILNYLPTITGYSPATIGSIVTDINRLKSHWEPLYNDHKIETFEVESLNSKVEICDLLLDLLNNQRTAIIEE